MAETEIQVVYADISCNGRYEKSAKGASDRQNYISTALDGEVQGETDALKSKSRPDNNQVLTTRLPGRRVTCEPVEQQAR